MRLRFEERKAAAIALPLVLGVRIALFVLPSRWIVRGCRRLAAESISRGDGEDQIPVLVWAVGAVARRIPGATCLTQAIAALVLFRIHGVGAEFCIGVAQDPDGAFRAHAWLERENRIVIGGRESRAFKRLPDLSRASLLEARGRKP